MPVEDVVQTATRLLGGQLAPREAATILSTLARDALPEARRMRHDHPGRADDYRELLAALAGELDARAIDDPDPRTLATIREELDTVRQGLDET